jgi:hypothetical protein
VAIPPVARWTGNAVDIPAVGRLRTTSGMEQLHGGREHYTTTETVSMRRWGVMSKVTDES